MEHFDVIVIGSGTAAMTVANRCRAAGRQVAIVDSRPFGGTCALRGCDPKKVLVGAAEAWEWSRRLEGKGIAGLPHIDWPTLMRFKNSFTDPVPQQRKEQLRKSGIAILHGRARFTGPATLSVGDEVVEGRQVVIAAGARPATLHVEGEQYLITSEQFLSLNELPRRIMFVGGGYISFEFAHIAARVGAAVSILHLDRRPLARFDPDLVEALLAKTRALGVQVEMDMPVRSIDRSPTGTLAVHAGAAASPQTFTTELAVHGAGRVADIDDMNLDAAGVAWESVGVKVNQFLQSISNPSVYAAGDAAATAGAPLTPVAGYEGQIAATNLLEGNTTTANYSGMASVVFTIPPLASVGLQEVEAKKHGLRFRTHSENTGNWFTSRRVGETFSAFKILIEQESGRILGAHLLGPNADEIINLFALAMRAELRVSDLKDVLFAYPTSASDVRYML